MRNWIEYSLQIADINIGIQIDHELKKTEAFLEFLVNQRTVCELAKTDWKLYFREDPDLKLPTGVLAYETEEYLACYVNNKYMRVFRDLERDMQIYGVSIIDADKKETQISYLPASKMYFTELSNCFFHSCWEKAMSVYGRFIFHAACIRTEFGGILFSGSSGIGKSTQANLWIEYEDAELINGDRTILYDDKEGEWIASGSPYAGSSKCYKNEQCHVKAIVMLKQAKDCSVRRLGTGESFRKIYQQCTVYSWDHDFVEKTCDFVEKICMQIPVYEYSCNISKEAVYTLKKELEVE